MAITADIKDVFSILHDGIISNWAGDKSALTLTIDCQYLAQRIRESFDKFYVELYKIDELYLVTWPNPFDLPVQTLTSFNKVFQADLEILSAEIEDKIVVVTCNQHNIDFDYCGGTLIVKCDMISVFDQNRNEVPIEKLDKICRSYWNELFISTHPQSTLN